jgi:hypothetical protein
MRYTPTLRSGAANYDRRSNQLSGGSQYAPQMVHLGFDVVFIPGSAIAQQTIPFSPWWLICGLNLDRPEMLVIYHITLSPSVSLPTNLWFRFPMSANHPRLLCARLMELFFSVQYQRMVRGQWADISLTATHTDIQIEYYDSIPDW